MAALGEVLCIFWARKKQSLLVEREYSKLGDRLIKLERNSASLPSVHLYSSSCSFAVSQNNKASPSIYTTKPFAVVALILSLNI